MTTERPLHNTTYIDVLNTPIEKLRQELTPILGQESISTQRTLALMNTGNAEVRDRVAVARVGAVVNFAKENAPFYTSHWSDIDGRDIKTVGDLQNIPVVTKEHLTNHTIQFQAQKAGRHTQTDFMTRPPLEGYSAWNTGGSSGIKTISIRTKDEWDMYVRYSAITVWPSYFNEDETVGVLVNASSGWSGAQIFGEIGRRATGTGAVQMFPSDGPAKVIDTMELYGVTALFTQPEALTNPDSGLLRYIADHPEKQGKWDKVVYGGSPLFYPQKQALMENGIEVYGILSQTEVGPLGVQPVGCQVSQQLDMYHTTPLNYFWLKEIDGEERIVAANLIYTVQPVVAHDAKDQAVFTNNCADCGGQTFNFRGRAGAEVVMAGKWRWEPMYEIATRILAQKGIQTTNGSLPQILIGLENSEPFVKIIVPGASSDNIDTLDRMAFLDELLEQYTAGNPSEHITPSRFKQMLQGRLIVTNNNHELYQTEVGKIPPFKDLRSHAKS